MKSFLLKNEINAKTFNILVMILVGISLFSAALLIIIDPFFHYHAPINGLAYPIWNERYQNNGIVRIFEYDAIITGTSMTENFRASEMNELFHVNAVKVPFSGAKYKEINDNLII